jgi:hypothetical protein
MKRTLVVALVSLSSALAAGAATPVVKLLYKASSSRVVAVAYDTDSHRYLELLNGAEPGESSLVAIKPDTDDREIIGTFPDSAACINSCPFDVQFDPALGGYIVMGGFGDLNAAMTGSPRIYLIRANRPAVPIAGAEAVPGEEGRGDVGFSFRWIESFTMQASGERIFVVASRHGGAGATQPRTFTLDLRTHELAGSVDARVLGSSEGKLLVGGDGGGVPGKKEALAAEGITNENSLFVRVPDVLRATIAGETLALIVRPHGQPPRLYLVSEEMAQKSSVALGESVALTGCGSAEANASGVWVAGAARFIVAGDAVRLKDVDGRKVHAGVEHCLFEVVPP